MRVAALYDVHGNVHVLEAVLGDVEREGVDEIVFGGDIAAGPFPMEPLAPVRSLDVEAAAARIRASGWPTAEQFATENVLTVPSREEATAVFGG